MRYAGFLLILTCGGVLLAIRASWESSLWLDEIFSVLLVQRPVDELIRITSIDRHPPGYYLLLKGWLGFGTMIGLEPGTLWGRLLGVFAWWLVLALMSRIALRHFGLTTTLILVITAACSPQAAYAARDMRGYALALPLLMTAAIILYELSLLNRSTSRFAFKRAIGWCAFALSCALSYWMHLLSVILIMLFGMIWMMSCILRPEFRAGHLQYGFAAFTIVLLSMLPWVFPALYQSASIANGRDTWMVPPTLENLKLVFIHWFPIGKTGYVFSYPGMARISYVITQTSLFIPLVGMGIGLLKRRDLHPGTHKLGLVSLGALGLAVTNVLILWLLDRYAGVHVFHGPRYTIFSSTFWLVGLAATVTWCMGQLRLKPWVAMVLITPLWFCMLVGQFMENKLERTIGLNKEMQSPDVPMPPSGSPLLVSPPELIPFYKNTLAEFHVISPASPEAKTISSNTLHVMVLNNWSPLVTRAQAHLVHLIKTDALAQAHIETIFPRPYKNMGSYFLYTLHDLDEAAWRDQAQAGFGHKYPQDTADAYAIAIPEQQWFLDGWALPPWGEPGRAYRVNRHSNFTMRFRGEVPAGRHTLNLWIEPAGDHETQPVALTLDLAGNTYQIGPLTQPEHLQLPCVIEQPQIWPIARFTVNQTSSATPHLRFLRASIK